MRKKIIEIIRNCCVLEEKNVGAETRLEDISLDSLSFVDAIVKIEQEFGFEFDDEDLNVYSWETVGELMLKAEEKFKHV